MNELDLENLLELGTEMLQRSLGILSLCCLSLPLILHPSVSVDLISQFHYLYSRKWPHPKIGWESGTIIGFKAPKLSPMRSQS